MKLYFYRGEVPNFGDELNTWLMPKVFPDFFDADDSTLFLGIGSVIFDSHKASARKIVFGSGYGGYTPLPVFDQNWKFYCVRGPRTAKACGLDESKVAGDTAILIYNYRALFPPTTIPCSFIPHWQSIARGHWQTACRLAGIHFIDPRLPVETVLAELQASRMVITEAMHGAIVSDALRVPWVPMLPIHPSHRWKWLDWAEALGLDLRPHRLIPSSTAEAWAALTQREAHRLASPPFPLSLALAGLDAAFIRAAAASLRRAARQEPVLSRDTALAQALDKLQTCGAQIRHDFARSP
jgi:hypothetical protein